MPIENFPVGILSDARIREAIKWSIPLITNADENSIQASSYDLRVGTVFLNGRILKWSNSEQQQVTIRPGGIFSFFTHEELQLPPSVMATAFPRNFWSSQGLLVLNPGHIDPGYRGPLTVRLINIRSTPKNINFGDRIFTVIFEKLPETPAKPYDKYMPRDENERQYNSLDVEQNPGGLGHLISQGENPPFVSIEQVNKAIRGHWMSWLALGLTAVAAIASVIAVIQAFHNDPKLDSNLAKPPAASVPANPPSH
jgi:deoxycytidine triphosphate deaminase